MFKSTRSIQEPNIIKKPEQVQKEIQHDTCGGLQKNKVTTHQQKPQHLHDEQVCNKIASYAEDHHKK